MNVMAPKWFLPTRKVAFPTFPVENFSKCCFIKVLMRSCFSLVSMATRYPPFVWQNWIKKTHQIRIHQPLFRVQAATVDSVVTFFRKITDLSQKHLMGFNKWRHDTKLNDIQHFSIMTLSITINKMQHSAQQHSTLCRALLCWVSIVLSVIYAECHIQALSAECHYAECWYAECRGAQLMGDEKIIHFVN